MYAFDMACSWLSFALISICLLVGPWVFGASEAWYFWPLAALIFTSSLLFCFRLFLKAYRAEMFQRSEWKASSREGGFIRFGFLAYAIFIVYAFIRMLTTEVHADAERSFLLFLLPGLIAAQVVYNFSAAQNRFLFHMMTGNLVMLGLYGIINHIFFHNAYTMWVPGEPQYQIEEIFRATGSYVCPDHFAGIMELLLGIGLAYLFTRQSRALNRGLGCALSIVAVAGIFFSKSRGAGATAAFMLAACFFAALFTWPKKQRIILRSVLALTAIAAAAFLVLTPNSYSERFSAYLGLGDHSSLSMDEKISRATESLKNTPRVRMYSAAYRAWKTRRVVGIGPGMHQNLWPHYAASPDGNRATMDWPTRINNEWHSFEVHSDWLQLLEEYGLVGLALFCVPLFCLCGALHALQEQIADRPSDSARRPVALISATLAFSAMAFHSLGDFNLQMPATGWMLAALLAIPLHEVFRPTRVSTVRPE